MKRMITIAMFSFAIAIAAAPGGAPSPADPPKDGGRGTGGPGGPGGPGAGSAPSKSSDLLAVGVKTLEGDAARLDQYRGKVLLIVNVASKCGYTPQYAELEELHKRYRDRGLVILGFPSNDFGGQEPGSSSEIRDFCTRQYAVTFPLMEKCQTKAGAGQSEIYRILGDRTGKLPTWNFGKYLVERDGTGTAFFESNVKPGSEEMVKAIEAALAASAPGAPPASPGAPPAGTAPKAPAR